ncbi:MAG: PAS domain S-box protein [bacterium]
MFLSPIELFVMFAAGTVVLIASAVTVVWNITKSQRKRLAIIEESEKRFRALIEHCSDVVLLFNEQGRIIFASPSLQLILGYSMEDLNVLSVWNIVHADDTAGMEVFRQHLINSSAQLICSQSRIRHKDGSWRWIEFSANNLLQEPAVRAVVVNFRDITAHYTAQEDLKQLARRVMLAREEENRYISRELHDSIGALINAAKLEINRTIYKSKPAKFKAIRGSLNEAEKLLGQTIIEVRRILGKLRPLVLDRFGFKKALENFCEEFQEKTGINILLEDAGLIARLPQQMEIVLFRIVQEALHNVEQHADAKEVTITLLIENKTLTMSIADNGRGFDHTNHQSQDGHFPLGIVGMKERAKSLGGSLRIHSELQKGTEIFFQSPFNGAETFHEQKTN